MAWWIALLGVTFFAAAAQSATGFGFGLIAVPVFLVLLDSIAAVQLVAIVTLVMSGALWLTIRQQASGQFLKWLLIGCALGFPLGILASSRLDIDAIKTSVAVLIIVFSSYNGWRLFNTPRQRVGKGPPRSASVIGVGMVSGLMASSMALPGPAAMLYLSATALKKDEIRATMMALFCFAYGGTILLQAGFIGIETQTWQIALLLTPAALLGTIVGHRLSQKISQTLFTSLILLLLLLTGVFMLANL